jgi:hypothetical protein
MCRTASAYQAEVDGSDIKTEYFGDYLDKCFIIYIKKAYLGKIIEL